MGDVKLVLVSRQVKKGYDCGGLQKGGKKEK